MAKDGLGKLYNRVNGVENWVHNLDLDMQRNIKNWINLKRDAKWWTTNIVRHEKEIKGLKSGLKLMNLSLFLFTGSQIFVNNETEKKIKALEKRVKEIEIDYDHDDRGLN